MVQADSDEEDDEEKEEREQQILLAAHQAKKHLADKSEADRSPLKKPLQSVTTLDALF